VTVLAIDSIASLALTNFGYGGYWLWWPPAIVNQAIAN